MMKRKMSRRSQIIGAIFLLLFFALIYRFYVLQVVDASFYQETALNMYERTSSLESTRGTIYDRNKNILAKEVRAYTVAGILNEKLPNHVKEPEKAARILAPHLNMSEERIYELLTLDRGQVELRPGGWKIDYKTREAIVEELKEHDISGIVFLEESKRFYPNERFASHILGYVDNDNEAKMGLELSLNEYLQGQDGYIQIRVDNRRNRLVNGVDHVELPEDGNDVILTLDERIQFYVEQAMDLVEEEYRPKKMTVIVSDPNTGEILGMGSRPSFNPNNYQSIDYFTNDPIAYPFEPGSTFKIVTLAAAIERGVYRDDETFKSGTYSKVPGPHIRDHNQGQGWGEITFREGVQKSSNVAFVKLGWERMSREVLFDYIDRFGFTEPTGIDLPNERIGRIPPITSVPRDIATMTYGQSISVTPIQQIQAINVIANGGTLYKPYMIDQIVNPNDGTIVVENKPVVVRDDVISKETADLMKDILESTVTDGTGRNFYIEGYDVVGKTGTAQKPNPDGGGYMQSEWIHSFVGFAPKDEPQLSVFVAIDAPNVQYSHLGGSVAAQVFKHVMQNSLQYLNVKPVYTDHGDEEWAEEEIVLMGDYTGMSPMEARQLAVRDNLDLFVIGDGIEVMQQFPHPGQPINGRRHVYLITGDVQQIAIPDFSGWSLRDVREWANITNMDIQIEGRGFVANQSESPGSILEKGHTLKVTLQPKHLDHSNSEQIQNDDNNGAIDGVTDESVEENSNGE